LTGLVAKSILKQSKSKAIAREVNVSVQEALVLLAEAEEKVRRAREMVEKELPSADQQEWVGGLILAEVLRDGGSVERDRLHRIAAKYGMDNRGLGGFFTGKGSLHSVADTDLVMLTPDGAKTAVRYLKKLRPEDEASSLAKMAERSFAEDWDSDEDSVYDKL